MERTKFTNLYEVRLKVETILWVNFKSAAKEEEQLKWEVGQKA